VHYQNGDVSLQPTFMAILIEGILENLRGMRSMLNLFILITGGSSTLLMAQKNRE